MNIFKTTPLIQFILIAMIAFLSGCNSEDQELIVPESQESLDFISINDHPELKSIKATLKELELVGESGLMVADMAELAEYADWTRIRKLNSQDYEGNEYDVYGMVLNLETEDYLNNLVIYAREGMQYPYLLSFNPSEEWKNNLSYRSENQLDGSIVITSLLSGATYEGNGREETHSARVTSCVEATLSHTNFSIEMEYLL